MLKGHTQPELWHTPAAPEHSAQLLVPRPFPANPSRHRSRPRTGLLVTQACARAPVRCHSAKCPSCCCPAASRSSSAAMPEGTMAMVKPILVVMNAKEVMK